MFNARSSFLSFQNQPLAVVLGTNEIASAVAVSLTCKGYAVVMSHDPFPPVIRRGMAFHDALYDDFVEVGGIVGERAESLLEIVAVAARREKVAVTPLSLTDLLAFRTADVLVDARMQKNRVTPDFRRLARITIGLGPKFLVGVNCDIAVEAQRSARALWWRMARPRSPTASRAPSAASVASVSSTRSGRDLAHAGRYPHVGSQRLCCGAP